MFYRDTNRVRIGRSGCRSGRTLLCVERCSGPNHGGGPAPDPVVPRVARLIPADEPSHLLGDGMSAWPMLSQGATRTTSHLTPHTSLTSHSHLRVLFRAVQFECTLSIQFFESKTVSPSWMGRTSFSCLRTSLAQVGWQFTRAQIGLKEKQT